MPDMPKPRIVLMLAEAGTRVTFVPAPITGLGVYPCVLATDNLRSAATMANRLEADADGNAPLPLLHVHACDRPVFNMPSDAIEFPSAPRLLAGLIADAVRAAVAVGAVVAVCPEMQDRQQLHNEIAGYLERAGFAVTDEVPGWRVEDAALALSR